MSETKTLYVRDPNLWERARTVAGSQGLSSLVERAIRLYLDQQEPLPDVRSQRFVLPVGADGESIEMERSIEFQGRLMVDSTGFSLEQIPRIRVYRTAKGRFVVYRSYYQDFSPPSYTAYPDLESLTNDRLALRTTWITEEDEYGNETDLTDELIVALRDAVGQPTGLLIDELEPSQVTAGPKQSVRLGRDDDTLRRSLHGHLDFDVLLVAMFLLFATEKDPKHLSEIYESFERIKPLSRLGNTAASLGDLPAAVRGYLNASRHEAPNHRRFRKTKRGFWGLSNIGETRATEILHRLGMIRG